MLDLVLTLRDLLPSSTTLLTANKTSLSVLGVVPVDITVHSHLLLPASSTILSAPGVSPSNPCNRILIVDKTGELMDPCSLQGLELELLAIKGRRTEHTYNFYLFKLIAQYYENTGQNKSLDKLEDLSMLGYLTYGKGCRGEVKQICQSQEIFSCNSS